VQSHVDGDRIVYRGPVGGADRTATLGQAYALLHLINFDEPFGLSVVEAMACGTPVIAIRRGSMAELIEDGVIDRLSGRYGRTGDRGEWRASVKSIGPPAAARQRPRFSVDRMADEYLALYRSILG
jgi:glycosyltransferase involved in cell wall biosynthesis